MRIVFVGAVDFSHYCLEKILKSGGEVVAVLNPEKSSARSNSDYADLAPLAEKYQVPLYRISRITDEAVVQLIRNLHPEILMVFGFSQLLPETILAIPPRGCLGTHPALLPKNRGRHPLIWTLSEGLQECGLTFFYLDGGPDSGDILWQKSFPVQWGDDAGTLYKKIKMLAGQAIKEFLPDLQMGTSIRRAQDHSQATYWRKRSPRDGLIRWDAPLMEVYNLIRALTRPYPGAQTVSEGKPLIIWKSRFPESREAPQGMPGEVVKAAAERFLVQCGDGLLEILDWDRQAGIALRVGLHLGA